MIAKLITLDTSKFMKKVEDFNELSLSEKIIGVRKKVNPDRYEFSIGRWFLKKRHVFGVYSDGSLKMNVSAIPEIYQDDASWFLNFLMSNEEEK
ncbi:hypothetical protein [Ligilactobacillus equi]|uniref:Molybdate ABC transporter periplasmic protein n=1 Tax=Ligilactobacillus equi DPC 6820 TaxID=1392007 RepID=V7HWV6_9LACO|nr:hypothetical protein [Ligilactobacillus equi]ETA73516.1 molybdate ABC transporter periplasmic protein [Ligilactobacillus equi DPC 6820]